MYGFYIYNLLKLILATTVQHSVCLNLYVALLVGLFVPRRMHLISLIHQNVPAVAPILQAPVGDSHLSFMSSRSMNLKTVVVYVHC